MAITAVCSESPGETRTKKADGLQVCIQNAVPSLLNRNSHSIGPIKSINATLVTGGVQILELGRKTDKSHSEYVYEMKNTMLIGQYVILYSII